MLPRLRKTAQKLAERIRQRPFLWLVLLIVGTVVEDRIAGWANDGIDSQGAGIVSWIATSFLWLSSSPLGLVGLVAVLLVLVMMVHAYIDAVREAKTHDEQSDEQPTTPENKRIFVSGTTTLDFLVGLYQGNTTRHQGDQRFASYKGKWMKVDLVVSDVRIKDAWNWVVIFGDQPETLEMAESEKWFKAKACLNFDASIWRPQLSHLNVGDKISVIGQIEGSDRFVDLVNCELVEEQHHPV